MYENEQQLTVGKQGIHSNFVRSLYIFSVAPSTAGHPLWWISGGYSTPLAVDSTSVSVLPATYIQSTCG